MILTLTWVVPKNSGDTEESMKIGVNLQMTVRDFKRLLLAKL